MTRTPSAPRSTRSSCASTWVRSAGVVHVGQASARPLHHRLLLILGNARPSLTPPGRQFFYAPKGKWSMPKGGAAGGALRLHDLCSLTIDGDRGDVNSVFSNALPDAAVPRLTAALAARVRGGVRAKGRSTALGAGTGTARRCPLCRQPLNRSIARCAPMTPPTAPCACRASARSSGPAPPPCT